jgi:hypothetical protein
MPPAALIVNLTLPPAPNEIVLLLSIIDQVSHVPLAAYATVPAPNPPPPSQAPPVLPMMRPRRELVFKHSPEPIKPTEKLLPGPNA